MIIQHNMPAFNANRTNKKNNSKLSKSLEKLSSGYAINRAGDNAAGLAVSEKMRSQIHGMTQAVKNCQDGVSLIQTFEGALGEIHTIIKRCKTLADQSANGSYDDHVDRTAIEQEFIQLKDEINQIADTDFNGIIMLNAGRMADNFTLVTKEGTQWLFPENVEFDSYLSTIQTNDPDYKLKVELMPGVSGLMTDKDTFRLLAALDLSSIRADVTRGIATFSFDGKRPQGFSIEEDRNAENTAIISFITPHNGVKEIARVSLPPPVHDAKSTAQGIWVETFDPDLVLTRPIVCTFDNGAGGQTLFETGGATVEDRQKYLACMAYLTGNPCIMTVQDDTAKKSASTGGGVVDKDAVTDISVSGTTLHISLDYNANTIKPGSEIIVSANRRQDAYMSTAFGWTADNDTDRLGQIASPFNENMFIKYGMGEHTFYYDDAKSAWYHSSDTAHAEAVDLSAAGINMTINARDPATGTNVDKPLKKITINVNDPYVIRKSFDGSVFKDNKNFPFTMGEVDRNNTDAGGIDYRTAIDKAEYTYVNDGVNSVNPDTEGYWMDENGARVDLESVGVYLPADPGDDADILHRGMKIVVSNPLESLKGKIVAGLDLWGSQSDCFRVPYDNLTYAESMVLQVGARTKDAVDFTFRYDSESIGDLAADLNCTTRGLGLKGLTFKTQESSNFAIDKLDQALNKVSLIRGSFGAAQNRLEHKIDNLNNTVENLTSAESRIRDADMAKEMMDFTKMQILSNASQSMLAQANSLPQGVMSLLQS